MIIKAVNLYSYDKLINFFLFSDSVQNLFFLNVINRGFFSSGKTAEVIKTAHFDMWAGGECHLFFIYFQSCKYIYPVLIMHALVQMWLLSLNS